MTNKDLIEIRLSDLVERQFREILEKHLSTTESTTNEGEWIEKAMNQYIKDFPLCRSVMEKCILDNLPKTNDKNVDEIMKKIDERIDRCRKENIDTFDDVDNWFISGLMQARTYAKEVGLSLKSSPTNTDE